MVELADGDVIYAFSCAAAPALTVDSGTTVRIRTKDCFGNQITGPGDEFDEIDWNCINPVTGPIYVNGALPGGALKVSVDAIEIDGTVICATGRDEGVCGDLFERWSTRLCPVENNELVWNDHLRIPLNPMIGVIGVAPAGFPINCGTPGSHGGNMDSSTITVGTTLYLPVATEGALFGCGDVHAVMGDGEVSVTGAEVASWVTVTLTALPSLHITNPVVETPTHLGLIASADTLDEAASIAVHQMVALVHDATGVPNDELVMLFSLVGDVEVCQMVDPQKTVRFMVPRYVLESYGFSL